ncbi:NAD-dependent epimerase/dehydratase family protein [Streptomyces sp. SYSU K21746]
MGSSSGKRIVVTGATGNCGTSVVQALGADPSIASILGIARRIPAWSPAKTEWAAADLSLDPGLEGYFEGADAVIHLAWKFQPTHDPAVTWRTNVLGSVRVFQAVAAAGVPVLVHASSVGAYSPGPKDRAVDESWPTHGWPEAGYCVEKAYLERTLDAFEPRHPGIRVVRMRPGFMFKKESASEQRRIFAGRFIPGALLRPGLLPAVPGIAGLRFQALHTDDAAQAYRLVLEREVSGAFNLAAEPPVDVKVLARLLDARVLRVPRTVARSILSAAWGMHLVPASPQLFDAVLHLPLMDWGRAEAELGWRASRTSVEAIEEFLLGLREGSGMDTEPLVGHKVG